MDAIMIYQALLDRVSAAVLSDDLPAYSACICTPYVVRTNGGVFVLRDDDDLRSVLKALSDGLRAHGVTDYIRIARSAEFLSPNHIEGTHFTHIMRDGDRIAAPHAGSMSLIRHGNDWRATEARYAVENTGLPIAFPELGTSSELPPPPPLLQAPFPFHPV